MSAIRNAPDYSLPQSEAIAIEQFLCSCTVPILYEQGQIATIRGTGTLFKIADRHFLVTARHIFDDGVNTESLGLPTSPRGPTIITFGESTIFRPVEAAFDVAVVEFKGTFAIDPLSMGWRFLEINNILSSSDEKSTSFVVCGYPSSLAKHDKESIVAKPATFFTYTLEPNVDVAEPTLVTQFDRFLEYAKDGVRLDNSGLQTPELDGVSGASVWSRVNASTKEIWSPERCLKIAGIQCSAKHDQFIRYADWYAVATLFGNMDDALGRHVQSYIDGEQ
jgi:hypothetical protein